ncbi:hypothetical protein [Chryseobacterium sp. Mn2064]|uniref:hypothetical protein n=1 Tax=Chryseobacterium sp. Mn2064 TaxID=3395263 RepID=UPI003BC0392A
MKKIQFSPLGEKTFLISFLAGSSLLFLYWITMANFLVIVGFYYVVIAAVANLLILLYELMVFLGNVSEKKSSGNSVLLMLVNIPIVLVYLNLFFSFC